MRNVITKQLALLFVLVASAGPVRIAQAQTAADEDRPPNVILIMADDLGYGALGCYGQEQIETPHLDQLAADGIRFTQAYAGAHVCQPSRSVLMTGLHTGHTPCRANDVNQYLWEEDVTIAELLRDRGYRTGLFGKWGLGDLGTEGHPMSQGFDRVLGQLQQVHAHFYYPAWIWDDREKMELSENVGRRRGRYVTDVIHEGALEFIRANQERPFFLYLPSILPHVELAVPERTEALYRGRFPLMSIQDSRDGYLGSEDGLATFAGMITHLDSYVGEIVGLLDELELTENTIVIFISDNGGQGGGLDRGWKRMNDFFSANGNLRGYKGSFYEGGIRVPMIVKWPNHIAADTQTDFICGFQDLLPTLSELARADAPTVDGISLVPILQQAPSAIQSMPVREGLYWEYPGRNGIGRAARMGDWKLVQSNPDASPELYDLRTDPSEVNNRAEELPERVELMIDWMDHQHTDPRIPRSQRKRPGLTDYVY